MENYTIFEIQTYTKQYKQQLKIINYSKAIYVKPKTISFLISFIYYFIYNW